MTNLVPVITIDGPTASGKGTIACGVATALGWHVLDSGSLYRLVALACVDHTVLIDDSHAVTEVARNLNVSFRNQCVFLENRDVTDDIRHEEIGNLASKIATYPNLRGALLELQRSFRVSPGLVADGRDMGTVVFKDAQLKVFLQASAQARAERRYKQLNEKGISANLEGILQDLQARDARDANRSIAPLRAADDAFVLDSSDLSVAQTITQVLNWYQSSAL